MKKSLEIILNLMTIQRNSDWDYTSADLFLKKLEGEFGLSSTINPVLKYLLFSLVTVICIMKIRFIVIYK